MLRENTKIKIPDINEFKIYMQRTSWGQFVDADHKKWERPYLNYSNMVTHEDIQKNQKKFIVFLSFFDLQELIDINPMNGSIFAYSLTEPFNEEMEIDFNRMKNWLDRFNLPIKQAHASGHAPGSELKELINTVNPNMVYPIHTEKPELFKKLYPKVNIVEYGKRYVI